MTLRSIKWAAGVSMFAAMLALGVGLPGQPSVAQGPVQAVPRAGIVFNSTVTSRATIESIDSETRTVAFTLAENGRLLDLAVADGVRNLDAVDDGSVVDITYTQVVTLLNLRQKGPGAKEARKESANPKPTDIDSGRFTTTVVAIDFAAKTVSVIDGQGGAVRTYSANTPAKLDMLQKMKVGDVVVGLTTPLLITAITPVK
ncbi:MAG: hypothetical protein ACHQK9_16360 [Reyranellales bacterium]